MRSKIFYTNSLCKIEKVKFSFEFCIFIDFDVPHIFILNQTQFCPKGKWHKKYSLLDHF